MNENVSLAALTTLKTGGKAKYFCAAANEEDVRRAAAFAKKEKLPIFILGGGSNTLVADEGFVGVVVKIATKGVVYEERSGAHEDVRAAAGENWDSFVADTLSRGFWGLENLSGIPGTVGAAPIQNIGAYGAEVKDSIESVRAFDISTGKEKVFSNAECGFEYRDSFFKSPAGKNFIILEVTFRLSRVAKPNISYKDLKEYFAGASTNANIFRESESEAVIEKNISLGRAPLPALSAINIRSAVLEIRSRKFPDLSKVGTAGSFFKNPIISTAHFEKLKSKYPDTPSFAAKDGVKIPLAFVLDRVCGLKGYKKGPVELFQNQPLVLVNTGGATAKEIKDFSNEIKKAVKEKTGIEIENEVVFVG